MTEQKFTMQKTMHFLMCALTTLLIVSPAQAETVYKSKEIFTPPNPNNVVRRYSDGLHKIGPWHAVFTARESKSGDDYDAKVRESLYVLDARSKKITKVASFQSPGNTFIRTIKANSRDVWIDVMGYLFLANSQNGSVKFIKNFGVEYVGSLGPWLSCLGLGFSVNNFSYFGVSDRCAVEAGESHYFIFDHSTQALAPITYDFYPDNDGVWIGALIFDNPLKADKTAIALNVIRQSGENPQVVQFWEIDPETKKTRLLKEELANFTYTGIGGSAKTSKGIFMCTSENVVRIANNLKVDFMSNKTNKGCRGIKEYRDQIIWEPAGPNFRDTLVLSDGTLSTPAYIQDNNYEHSYLGCETWGKLFYNRSSFSLFPNHRASSIKYIDERFNTVEIPLDQRARVESCLNNKLVLSSDHGARSIYDLLTNSNKKVIGSADYGGSTQIVELGTGLFALKYKKKDAGDGYQKNVDFSLHELILAEQPTYAPIYDLLLSE